MEITPHFRWYSPLLVVPLSHPASPIAITAPMAITPQKFAKLLHKKPPSITLHRPVAGRFLPPE
jgi:hypothetical protein